MLVDLVDWFIFSWVSIELIYYGYLFDDECNVVLVGLVLCFGVGIVVIIGVYFVDLLCGWLVMVMVVIWVWWLLDFVVGWLVLLGGVYLWFGEEMVWLFVWCFEVVIVVVEFGEWCVFGL